MKNFPAFILSITLIISLGFGFSSCKEDEPPAKPKLSFADTEITVNEDDGVLEVELVLDKAHSKDLRIEYELGGTADDQDVVGTANADYEVSGTHGVVEIDAGETSGTIELDIYPDAGFEEDETIEIAIIDINTDEVELTADDEVTITVVNDDEQLTASFAATTLTVNEADGVEGLLEIAVQLDKTATAPVTIEYTLAGTALDSVVASEDGVPPSYYDYYINSLKREVVIPAGQSTANIEIQVYSDFRYENDETIEITLTGSTAAQIGTNNKMTITVEQQDGKVIALVWDNAYTDVDMDMFLWIGEDVNTLDGVIATAIVPSTEVKQEIIFIPKVFTDDITEAAFGVSYVYYSGTANPMNFEAHFVDFAAGELEAEASRDIYAASYTLDNINAWDETEVNPIVVQTFRVVNGEFVDLTGITVPASGSRVKTYKLPEGLQKRKSRLSKPL
jgi:hypothetical protein